MLLSASLKAGFIEEDKQAHIAATAMTSAISTVIAREYDLSENNAFIVGIVSGMLVGVSKELYDKSKGYEFSESDLMADFVGSLAGTSIVTFTYKF